MNYKRAIFFSILFYVVSLIAYVAIRAVFGQGMATPFSGWEKLALLVVQIPITLLLAKWFFKAENPSPKKGVLLGIIALVCSAIFDGIYVLILLGLGHSAAPFSLFYGSWLLYATIVETLLITTFSGWEFDATYTENKA